MFVRIIPLIVAATLLGYGGVSVAQSKNQALKGEAAEPVSVTAPAKTQTKAAAPSAQSKNQALKGEAAEPVSVTAPAKTPSKAAAPGAQSKNQQLKGEAAEPVTVR